MTYCLNQTEHCDMTINGDQIIKLRHASVVTKGKVLRPWQLPIENVEL